MNAHALPSSSTPFERSVSIASDVHAKVASDVTSMRGLKIINPPSSFLPWLVYEYGLGELTPYVPNLYDLISEGIDWQRVRGTPAAVAMALNWLSYSATIEEFPTRRRHWNFFQLEMDRVRDDEADLIRIEGVTQLSVSLRSVFWRGFHGYDVRALEYSRNRWSGSLWGSYSGARVAPGQTKWSFGRGYAFVHDLTQAELEALDVWIAPTGDPLTWGSFPWPEISWNETGNADRSVLMLSGIVAGTAWAVFRDADGDVIGYRRARARRRVVAAPGGPYEVGGTRYGVAATGAKALLVEALTDFGDGYGSTAASVEFVLSGEPAEDYPVGALWLPAGGLADAGPSVAETEVDIEFGRTVRERVTAILRF